MRKILLSVMTALLLFTAGCDKPPTDPPKDPPKQGQTGETTDFPNPEIKENPQVKSNNPSGVDSPIQTMKITVYYPDDSGMSLVAVEREIKFSDEDQKYLEAVKCLLDPPNEDNITKIFPKGAKINSITRDGDTAVVDLDSGITKNFVGGSTGEEFLINSVVETLTEFEEVKQVRFLLDGKTVETLAGHMDLSEPIKR